MVNWKKLYNQIPSEVQIGKSKYRIFWVDGYPKCPEQLGETNFDYGKFISININQSIKESVSTYLHEIGHAISQEWGINLTERQVTALEESLPSLLKVNNVFKKEIVNAVDKRKRRTSKRVR